MPQSPVSCLVMATALVFGGADAATPTISFPFKSLDVSATGGAAGQLTVRTPDSKRVLSVVTLHGLTPNTVYVAQYHALGSASSDPCASGGSVTLGFPAFRTNAQGQGSALLQSDQAKIGGVLGAYVDVHIAATPAVVALCAAVPGAGVRPAAQNPTPAAQAALQQTIRIGDNFFMPASISVPLGTTVTWVSGGKVTHNVLSGDLPGLHSTNLYPGERYIFTFKTPGTFTYYCSYHEGMSATIIVTDR